MAYIFRAIKNQVPAMKMQTCDQNPLMIGQNVSFSLIRGIIDFDQRIKPPIHHDDFIRYLRNSSIICSRFPSFLFSGGN